MNKTYKAALLLIAFVLSYTITMAADPVHGVDVKLGAIQSSGRQTPKRDFGDRMLSKTDDKGVAVFKDVPAGEYKITIPMKTLQDFAIKEQGVKAASSTEGKKGLNAVNVKQAVYEVSIDGTGKNIRKNITVNLTKSNERTTGGITGLDDWESPVILKSPDNNANFRWTLEVRVQRIEMK